jgi:hypothetical protein
MSQYRDQVRAVLAAVRVPGPGRYVWLGRASRAIAPALDAALDHAERRAHLVSSLSDELYWSFYCRGAPGPARWGEPGPQHGDDRLVAELAAANAADATWEPGWTVDRVDAEEAVVSGPSLRMRVPVAGCRPQSGAVRAGAAVSVRVPSALPALAPGFCMLLGAAPVAPETDALVRVYWHVTPAAAPRLVGVLTGRLNASGVPFQLKVADHPAGFDRCDAAVLYLPADAFGAQETTLRAVAAELAPGLRPAIPAFTRALVPGVAVAESDGGAESFGTRRCEWLADGIVRAYEHGVANDDMRVAVVAGRFAEAGVDLDAPYLDPALAGRHVL